MLWRAQVAAISMVEEGVEVRDTAGVGVEVPLF